MPPQHNISITDPIEGIEGIEHLTNGLYGDEFEDYLIQQMYLFSDEVVEHTITLRTEWAIDANSPKSLAMEKQVAEMLEIPHRIRMESTTGLVGRYSVRNVVAASRSSYTFKLELL